MRRLMRLAAGGILLASAAAFGGTMAAGALHAPAGRQEKPGSAAASALSVPLPSTLDSLLADEDTDRDERITIEDRHIPGTERGDKRFWISRADGTRFEINGTYYLSNLLQELKLAEEQPPGDTARLLAARIFEPPADRISRSIRELYWDGLTRRIDEQGLARILPDEKTRTVDGMRYLYVPRSDTFAFHAMEAIADRHPDWKMKVVQLPARITPDYVRSLAGKHGLLSLALLPAPGNAPGGSAGKVAGVPFVVPGGRFNEMYGWDSYFITLGLLQDGRIELAKSMVDNFIYEITHYGAILNANRSYYLTRSQPPFFTSMALAVYDRMPKSAESREWLRTALQAAIREYDGVWMNQDRLTSTGLSRYYDFGSGVSPEVEPGHFAVVFARFAKKYKMSPKRFAEAYRSGKLKVPELDRYFVHDRSMRESGHDTSYRLEERSADLVTVDLNSLLYKIETDIARAIRDEFGGSVGFPVPPGGKGGADVGSAETWEQRSLKRKELINRYLWNGERGMFFDYDVREGKQTGYVSATTFYPMWAGLATKEQAASLVARALPMLEAPGGIAGSTEAARGKVTPGHPLRQWDYPFGWAPHQIIAWQGMRNFGYDAIAERLAYRWLFTITLNAADYNGTVPEKFDVARRSHQVFAEYGNVGTTFSYITREGFGWTNASYQIGLSLLPDSLKSGLNRLIPPEWLSP